VVATPAEADVLVVGGGMAGAIAALAAREAGARAVVVRRSPGATALSSGAIGVAPDHATVPGAPLSSLRGPLDAARRLAAVRPDHPYAVLGPAALEALPEALRFVARALAPLLEDDTGAAERPRVLATVYGTAVACALCQRSMAAGDLLRAEGILAVVGFRDHLAFDAQLVAAGLERYRARGGPAARPAEVELPVPALHAARPHELARALEAPGVAEELGARVRAVLPAGAAIALLPPVLGLALEARVAERVGAAAGLPVAETVSDVPSVPGIRLQRRIDAALAEAGVPVLAGDVASAARPGEPVEVNGEVVRARSWILATGRFVAGGVVRRGTLVEPALRLPVQAAEGREAGVHLAARPAASLSVRDRRAPQPILSAGLRVDAALRPVDERGEPVHPRLHAAGAVIGGHEQATDGTGLGVAILTGYLAGRRAAGG
jgi:glycerol-3-phosphate dehydrogenase subunit B